MGLTERPYVGTWRLNGKELIQSTPDALVYVNGDTTVPGCAKCNGRIDLQQFLTEVSVDAGTDPGSASASFTLSIPLHHTDSFARDANFILHPGLEIHAYMRGHFPVKGLYSHLAEPRVTNTLVGGSDVSTAAVGQSAGHIVQTSGRTARFPVTRFLNRGESLDRLTPEQVSNLNELALNMDTLRQYMEQLGVNGHLPGYASGLSVGSFDAYSERDDGVAHVEHSEHYQGRAVDLNITYKTQDGARVEVNRTTTWAALMKLRESGHMKKGGVGGYVKAVPVSDTVSGSTKASDYTPTGEWFTSPHYDTRGTESNWYWYGVPGTGDRIQSGGKRPAVFDEALSAMPTPDGSVMRWNKQGDDGGPSAPIVEAPSVQVPETQDSEGIRPVQSGDVTIGPSVLEEHGLDGQGIENVMAYPYYHVFHGVVTEVGHSYSGGVNTITVNCSSMLHFWQYQNMSTNASVFGARVANSGNKMSMVGHNFTGMHPYQIMWTLHHDMVGAAGGVGWALSQKTNQTAKSEIGGESLFSLNIRYWERRFQGRVAKLRMHGATGEMFSTMQAAWLGRSSSNTLLSAVRNRFNTASGRKNDASSQSVSLNLRDKKKLDSFAAEDAGRKEGGAKTDSLLQGLRSRASDTNVPKFEINIVEMQAFVSNIGNWGQINLFESTYESKLDIANKVCEITGFEFYQDVDGDFVFKPPMYNLDTSASRVYRIEDIDLINISFSEKEPQVTYMTVKGTPFKNIGGLGLENEWGVQGQYIDYRLVAQFGWRPGSYETSYFTDPKSMFFAAVNRMDIMNTAVMNTANVTIPVRPELRPGYPVYIPYLDCFYYCNSFAHSHSVGGQCTTSLQLIGKRAKFYAPGHPTVSGVGAIDLADTTLPQRPLIVADPDGRPRLSGFPNVVMALDPTEVNPLFFVVGMDIERIDEPRVMKWILDTGVKLRVLSMDPAGRYEIDVPMMSGVPRKVLFSFQESDFPAEGKKGPTKVKKGDVTDETGGTLIVHAGKAATQYANYLLSRTGEKGSQSKVFAATAALDAQIDEQRNLIRQLNSGADPVIEEPAPASAAPTPVPATAPVAPAPGFLATGRAVVDFFTGSPAAAPTVAPAAAPKPKAPKSLSAAARETATAAALDKAESLEKARTAQILASQGKEASEEAEWKNLSGEHAGVAFLLNTIERIGEVYRVTSGDRFGDMNSTINLLDMLSDKKAMFTTGTLPGTYRYYSASHPDPKHQAPDLLNYSTKSRLDTLQAPEIDVEDGESVPEVLTYVDHPTAPFEGAKVPEAMLVRRKPQRGIRVLNSNSAFKNGQAVSTSDVCELMFTPAAVTATTKKTTTVKASLSTGSFAANADAIAATMRGAMGGPPVAETIIGTYFRPGWERLRALLTTAVAVCQDQWPASVPRPQFPSFIFPLIEIRTKFGVVLFTDSFGAYKYSGSAGTKRGPARARQGLKGFADELLREELAKDIGTIFDKIGTDIRNYLTGVPVEFVTGSSETIPVKVPFHDAERWVSTFKQTLAAGLGVTLLGGDRARGTVQREFESETYGPVFPISDARGYTVVGSYRYGRGVDIEPQGVFRQMHALDPFSLLDKHTVEKILRLFVQRDSASHLPIKRATGPKGEVLKPVRWVPSEDGKVASAADSAAFLGDEVIRQLRAANLTDKQILDYGWAVQNSAAPDQLDLQLANWFAEGHDGISKIPVINAAFSLADLTGQTGGTHVCDCKAAEAGVLVSAFGQEQFVTFDGSDGDASTRWSRTVTARAAEAWRASQEALRGTATARTGTGAVPFFGGGLVEEFRSVRENAAAERDRLIEGLKLADADVKRRADTIGDKP